MGRWSNLSLKQFSVIMLNLLLGSELSTGLLIYACLSQRRTINPGKSKQLQLKLSTGDLWAAGGSYHHAAFEMPLF